MFRNAPVSFAVDAIVSLAMLVAPAVMGESYQGRVMTVSQGKLMVATADAQVIIDVPATASVLLDGKAAALTDLQTGFHVVVAAGPQEGRVVATMVTATSGGVARGERSMQP